MTQQQIQAYLVEFERRFRARTIHSDILSALPEYRVGRSEMRAWFTQTFECDINLDDTMELDKPLKTLLKSLRREFPNERWS